MMNDMDDNEYCCGMHEVCEHGRLHRPVLPKIEYYDDEELDVLKGRSSDSYTPEEIEQFREVLTTMYESDIPGWLQSLKLRDIAFPETLKSEFPPTSSP